MHVSGPARCRPSVRQGQYPGNYALNICSRPWEGSGVVCVSEPARCRVQTNNYEWAGYNARHL